MSRDNAIGGAAAAGIVAAEVAVIYTLSTLPTSSIGNNFISRKSF